MTFFLHRFGQLIAITTMISLLIEVSFGSEERIFEEDDIQNYYCSVSRACSCNIKSVHRRTIAEIICPFNPNNEVVIVRPDIFSKLEHNGRIAMTLHNKVVDNITMWTNNNFKALKEEMSMALEIQGTNLVSISSNFFSSMKITLTETFTLNYNKKLHVIPSFLLTNEQSTSLSSVEIKQNGINTIEAFAFKGLAVESFTLWEPDAKIHPQAFEGAEISIFNIKGAKMFPWYLKNMSKVHSLVVENFEFNELPEDGLPLSLTTLELRDNIGSQPLKIDINAFRGLSQLKQLTMINCRIVEMADGVLRSNKKLTELNLAFNNLNRINEKDLLSLKELITVDVSKNNITHLPQSIMAALFRRGIFPSLNTFNIGYNSLTTVPNPQVASSDRLNGNGKPFMLHLNDNSFICDCQMKWMLESWVRNFITLTKVSCSDPKDYVSLEAVLAKNVLDKCNYPQILASLTPPSSKTKVVAPPVESGGSPPPIRDDILVIVVTVVAVAVTVFIFVLCWKYRSKICSHGSRRTTKYSDANIKYENEFNDVECCLDDHHKSRITT